MDINDNGARRLGLASLDMEIFQMRFGYIDATTRNGVLLERVNLPVPNAARTRELTVARAKRYLWAKYGQPAGHIERPYIFVNIEVPE